MPAALIDQAKAAGDAATIDHLTGRLEEFRQIHAAAQQATEQPPVLRALTAFVQAGDEDAAAVVFSQQRMLLQLPRRRPLGGQARA